MRALFVFFFSSFCCSLRILVLRFLLSLPFPTVRPHFFSSRCSPACLCLFDTARGGLSRLNVGNFRRESLQIIYFEVTILGQLSLFFNFCIFRSSCHQSGAETESKLDTWVQFIVRVILTRTEISVHCGDKNSSWLTILSRFLPLMPIITKAAASHLFCVSLYSLDRSMVYR